SSPAHTRAPTQVPKALVASHGESVGRPSSTKRLQLLSRPSQTSSAGVGASQADQPSPPRQVLRPQQVPASLATLHGCWIPSLPVVQSQLLVTGMHCRLVESTAELLEASSQR